jgi:hypothetical protein
VIMWRSKGFLYYSLFCWTAVLKVRGVRVTHPWILLIEHPLKCQSGRE